MSQQVLLTISDHALASARAMAESQRKPVEEIISGWVEDMAHEVRIESLSDDEILNVAQSHLPEQEQEQLSDLLAKNQARELTPSEQAHLARLLEISRWGSIRKAKALKTAVERGLLPPLGRD